MVVQSDHDLLVRIDERLKNVERWQRNHFAHHWAVTLSLIGITIGAIVTAILSII